jgi:hypothetical protein
VLNPVNPGAATIAAEFGSGVSDEMSVFQAFAAGNGTNPFKLAPLPSDI